LKTLLLAENHLPTLEHLQARLIQAGYKVNSVSGAAEAMERLASERPDAILLAVDFPRLKGLHLGELIRGTEHGRKLPLIAIDKEHLKRAKGVTAVLRLRPDAYLANPLKEDELLAKLASLLSTVRPDLKAARGLELTLSRAPVAAGELGNFPLPDLLFSSFRLSRDGVLVVASGDLTRRAFLLGGRSVAYDSTARQDSFSEFLVDRGDVSAAQAQDLIKEIQAGIPLAAALWRQAAIRGEEVLRRLRIYLQGKIAQMVGMRKGRYAFYAGNEFATEISPVAMPALAPILEGARRNLALKFFTQALRPRLGEFPRAAERFVVDLPALGLSAGDLAIALQVNGRARLRDLLLRGSGDLRRTSSLYWFLSLTENIEYASEPVAGSAEGEQQPSAHKPRLLPPKVLQSLREEALSILNSSYLGSLGLEMAATGQDVESAYREVAARLHPDSFAEYDTAEIAPLLQSVQEKLLASYRVLSDEEKRKEYLNYLLTRAGESRSAELKVDAELALRRGEAALRNKDFGKAAKFFEQAVTLNPREPEYYCFLAWATYLADAGPGKESAKRALRVLNKALALNPYLEHAAVISAIIEGESGNESSARKKLLKVLELNPDSKLAKAALRKVGK
jgi:CheY-like chemotaxis protein/tetratricopeptide (TPR) repeat protein